jgi:uncharacterized protein (TIGR02391 family)
MSGKEHIIRVHWDAGLQISKGDEIEISRGIARGDSIQASQLRNITTGRNETSSIDDELAETMPKDIKPPIHGVVKTISGSPSETDFELVEGVGVLEVDLRKLIKETEAFLDKEIVEKCIHKKDAEDIVTSAFRILEERIRAKIGVGPDRCGVDLINDAFNPKTGKLVLGRTPSEQEGLFHLYRGSIGFLRNPPSHRFIDYYSEFEIFEIVVHVNLLLNLLGKCKTRTP